MWGVSFTTSGTISGRPRNRIAAISASTGLATNWNPNVTDANSFVGGTFATIGEGTPQPRGRIAALDLASGEAIATWQADVLDYGVQSLALAGSSLYVGGNYTSIGGQNRNRLAALEIQNGTRTTWNPNVSGSNLTYVHAIAISFRNSKIYVGGNFQKIGNETRTGFAGMDNPFDPPTSVKKLGDEPVPLNFVLSQNYPNPFNPSTNIRFRIPRSVFVTLKVYDILGREVATLVNEQLTPGGHETTFDGAGLASGVYFHQLHAGESSQAKRLLLLQ